MQPLFQSPSNPNHRSPFHLHDAIVPRRLEDLAIHTGWPKDLPDGFFIELESVRGSQRNIFEIHSVGNVLKEGQRVLVAASADHSRRPKPRLDFDGSEDPDRLLLTPDDGSDLVGLKLRDGEPRYFLIVKATTTAACSFQPAIDSVPGDSLDS